MLLLQPNPGIDANCALPSFPQEKPDILDLLYVSIKQANSTVDHICLIGPDIGVLVQQSRVRVFCKGNYNLEF